MTRNKVVLTGAGGTIASLWIQALRERYDLVPVDVRTTHRDGHPIEGVQIIDLLDRDRSSLRQCIADAYAVVHGGFVRASPPETPESRLWTEMQNVAMAANVYQAALEAQVRRVVVASSNHATDYYESFILDGRMDLVTPETKTASYGFYGWAKEAIERFSHASTESERKGKSGRNASSRVRLEGVRQHNGCRHAASTSRLCP